MKRMNFQQHMGLLGELVTRDLKLKYRRSVLGYFWSLLNPLMTMFVMYIVFSNIFRFDIPNYPVYLISGQMIFNYMSAATSQAMYSIVGNGALLKKTYVPKAIFAESKITSGLVEFLFSLLAMFVVMMISGASFHWHMLFIPVVALELYVFCMGLGLFLATATVFFRDVQYVYNVFLTVWMYCTPIFYPFDMLPPNLQLIFKCFNPMYSYITQFRDLILNGQIPGYALLGSGVIWSLISLLIGSLIFKRKQHKFILYI